VPVKNTVPRIIVSESPGILIPISGKPVWRKVPNQPFERVINTRALILRPIGGSGYFIHVYDGFLSCATLDGTWLPPPTPPQQLAMIAQDLASKGEVVLLDGGNATPKPSARSWRSAACRPTRCGSASPPLPVNRACSHSSRSRRTDEDPWGG
jgi:hypothetical protein